ncbi:DNA-directed DNA/RNA polymerase mu-like isoform X2 [Gigantopelta aegis]|uniref:DNA-directed DNA/RNA polymerase mu-like isoform X2 n=1 Tax=Gigantopelta aegis TaxID=1735272 RepID=UPI001B88D3C3|nr:DNA-directed DNA/RNA polymerase mu-like isoform X2 [Gigantopelta aegis]
MATSSRLTEKIVNNKTLIYILSQRIQRRRLEDIKKATKKKQINLSDSFSSNVTHVVTESDNMQQVIRWLDLDSDADLHDVEVVTLTWLTDSLKAGKPVTVEAKHRVNQDSEESVDEEHSSSSNEPVVADWACQRVTLLRHHNHQFVDALEILQKYAEMRDVNQDYSRALAFRRASCVLKSLPFTVTSVSQIENIKDMGAHSLRVIQEILNSGVCQEVETIKKDDWFQKMKMFTSVFGVGPSTAKKWIERGWTSVRDAQQSDNISSDWRLIWGLAFHSDLMKPVLATEADVFTCIVREETDRLLPGAIVELTGGFRRKKQSGHDVDILITHPDEGKETGLLKQLLERLERRGLVLCGNLEKSTYTDDVLVRDFKLSMRGQLDHFEKWLGICKFHNSFQHGGGKDSTTAECVNRNASEDRMPCFHASLDDKDDYEPKAKLKKMAAENLTPKHIADSDRGWTARRVDLIICPFSQYWYALVGWTGSKHFNRDLRLYAQRVHNMKLTSHGLYSQAKGKIIAANSEKDVFDNLTIPYREPYERNC